MLLQVRNLTTEFRTNDGINKAIDDISFDVFKGEILGIVGESGSGKSVTALSIMQLIAQPGRISYGKILYNYQNNIADLLRLDNSMMGKYRGKEIAMIFQEPMISLNPVLKCGLQVAETMRLHKRISEKEARLRTIELFKKTELTYPDTIFDSYPFQLSGGQKQRVMIAMAVSCRPQLLIADEPTTALDLTVQKSILNLLRQLQAETGMSIIFISHDLDVIAQLAQRVLVMYKGKIAEQGVLKDVFQNPQHPYTKGLLECRPLNHKRGERLSVINDFIDDGVQWTITKNRTDENSKPEVDQGISILKVMNLKKYFPVRKNLFGKQSGEVKAVDDVSFEVKKGETVGLVGESGCGKTTLGRAILRLIEPGSGSVVFKEKNLTALNKSEMRKMRKYIQIIFQDPYSSLNPRITIGEAIKEPMRVYKLYSNEKERKEKVEELLKKVNLNPGYFNRYPHEFSGGQRQRIVIARALAVHPEFIICDEAVSALDVSIQAQVLNLLNDLKKEFNFTYLFVSHDLSVVKYMSDRMLVMNKGRIEEVGVPDEIYNNPKSEYTRKLIDAIPMGIKV